MSVSTSHPPVERARPLLGTRVDIRVSGLPEAEAQRAIDAGFAAIAEIHGLMSFHEAASDVSALNRDAAHGAVAVNLHTFDVIRRGLALAAASGGVFDMTVAAQLVSWGFLPRPEGSSDPDPQASASDIELLSEGRVRFHRPLWIDLGGIAKGYAVDRAIETVRTMGALQCCVNAGGDLRVAGPLSERVLLRTDAPGDTVPVVEIENGSLASSSGREHLRHYESREVGPHLHGVQRLTVGTQTFVSVVAEECVWADALTKVVLARGAEAEPVLRAYGATAYLQSVSGGWQVIGGETP